MTENNPEETFFHEIMSRSKLKVPFTDFDDKIMMQISSRRLKASAVSRDLKLSWIFFILGAVTGVLISIILPTIHESVLGIQPEKLTTPFQIIFVFLLVTQLDNLNKFYRHYSRRTKPPE